jgi:hypothetical protein
MRFCQLLLAVALGGGTTFGSQTAAEAPVPAPGALLPPTPPPAKSPVDVFRELLAMPPAQRQNALTNGPSGWQRQMLAKLSEYDSLSPNQRALRLKATELSYYLWPLLKGPVTNRASRLEAMPGEIRALVTKRLEEWDKLSPSVQNEIRDQETALRYFTETQGATPEQQDRTLESLSPPQRQKLEATIEQWRALPKPRREKALEQFDRLFGLNAQEKQRALSSLSEPERRKIEKTIDSFSHLSPTDRVQCIRALDRFTAMSSAERQQFLKNAELWRTMSPDQRDAWAKLVSKYSMQPPLPPGLGSPPMPPMPRPAIPARAVATNGN